MWLFDPGSSRPICVLINAGPETPATGVRCTLVQREIMFERQLALEHAQGYRGPATKLIGPIRTRDEARLVIRECALAVGGLGAFQVFLTVSVAWGSIGLGLGLMFAAVALWLWPTLPAATAMLALCLSLMLLQLYLIRMGYFAAVLIPLVRCLFAARAFWAARCGRALTEGAWRQAAT